MQRLQPELGAEVPVRDGVFQGPAADVDDDARSRWQCIAATFSKNELYQWRGYETTLGWYHARAQPCCASDLPVVVRGSYVVCRGYAFSDTTG
jgi:hypothetical protein